MNIHLYYEHENTTEGKIRIRDERNSRDYTAKEQSCSGRGAELDTFRRKAMAYAHTGKEEKARDYALKYEALCKEIIESVTRQEGFEYSHFFDGVHVKIENHCIKEEIQFFLNEEAGRRLLEDLDVFFKWGQDENSPLGERRMWKNRYYNLCEQMFKIARVQIKKTKGCDDHK